MSHNVQFQRVYFTIPTQDPAELGLAAHLNQYTSHAIVAINPAELAGEQDTQAVTATTRSSDAAALAATATDAVG